MVAAVGDGAALVEAVVEHRPDVSIVDVRMPPSHTDEGLRAAVEARRLVPRTPVLVLSQYVEVSYADDLLADRGRRRDRLPAQGPGRRRRRVPGRAGPGGRPAARCSTRRWSPSCWSGAAATTRCAALTPREREVLGLMAEGRSNTAIARALVVSDGAVEKHVRNIFTKLDLPPDESSTAGCWPSWPTCATLTPADRRASARVDRLGEGVGRPGEPEARSRAGSVKPPV